MNWLYDNFISDFLVIVIQWIVRFIGEYSIAIILSMLLVRFVLLPLDLKSKRSMKQMAALGPEVENLKKRYANNPEQLNRKVQELYKERGISTMAGCIPMLITLPLLMAFYGALRSIAAEQTMALVLRAAENGAANTQLTSWLWVRNLWQPDSGSAGIMPTAAEFLSFLQQNTSKITPQAMEILKTKGLISYSSGILAVNEPAYTALSKALVAANGGTGYANGWFILPVLSGGTQFLSQWIALRKGPKEQQQQGKMMLYMFPVLSGWICLSSNSMFAIYWTFSNIYAMLMDLIFNFFYERKQKRLEIASRKVS